MPSTDLMDAAERGEAAIGGCLVTDTNPTRLCENGQATRASYRQICDGTIGGFPTIWRVLRQLMAPVLPGEVFLTNAFVGLPDLPSDTAPFPTTPSFGQRCQRLLAQEIQMFRPRTVVCLGVAAAKMLAAITFALDPWQPWPGYAALGERAAASVRRCFVDDVEFIAVAVRHQSAVVSSEERRRDTDLIARAATAAYHL